MYKLIKSLGFMAVLLGISLVSCEEDYPKRFSKNTRKRL